MAEGRRQRVREKVRRAGIDALSDHEVIELYLYPFERRKDTGNIGRVLLKRFGSLQGVFSASYEELLTVKELPRLAALYMSQHMVFCRRSSIRGKSSLDAECYKRAKNVIEDIYLDSNDKDITIVIYFDSNYVLAGCHTFNAQRATNAEIVKLGVKMLAKYYAVGKVIKKRYNDPTKLMDSIIELNKFAKSINTGIYDYYFIDDGCAEGIAEALYEIKGKELDDQNKLWVYHDTMKRLERRIKPT